MRGGAERHEAPNAMKSLVINGGQLVMVALAFLTVWRLSRQPGCSRLFWPVVWVGSAFMAAVLFLVTEPPQAFEDFRRAYWEAGVAAWQGRAEFAALYARGSDGFVNLPIIAWLFAPFGLIGETTASLIFTALGVAVVGLGWFLLSRLLDLDRGEKGLLLVAIAAFGPMIYSVREGNISHFLFAVLILAMLDVRNGHDIRAGILFGIIALIKPPLILIGVYFLLRRRWRLVCGGVATLACVCLASLILYGWDLHMVWYQTVIAPFATGPTPAFNVQSFPAFILRQELGIASFLDWTPHALSGGGRVWTALFVGSLAAVCLWAATRRGGWKRAPDAGTVDVELMMVVTFACLVSSLTWSHYYVWLLPAYAMTWTQGRDIWRWIAIGAFGLSMFAEFISWPMASGEFGLLSNLLTSHLMIGGLMLMACLVVLRVRAEGRAV
jgi:hypothetical protein